MGAQARPARHGVARAPNGRSRCIRPLTLTTALLALLTVPATAAADRGCNTRACAKRVAARAHRAEMRRYRRHPMPRCTWEPESSWDPATGRSYIGRPWAPGRYRVINPKSGAGGKYQILPSTYRTVGGRGAPHLAPPVVQERLARRILRTQGLEAWVNC